MAKTLYTSTVGYWPLFTVYKVPDLAGISHDRCVKLPSVLDRSHSRLCEIVIKQPIKSKVIYFCPACLPVSPCSIMCVCALLPSTVCMHCIVLCSAHILHGVWLLCLELHIQVLYKNQALLAMYNSCVLSQSSARGS